MIYPFQKIAPLSTLHTNHLQLSSITVIVHLLSKHIFIGYNLLLKCQRLRHVFVHVSPRQRHFQISCRVLASYPSSHSSVTGNVSPCFRSLDIFPRTVSFMASRTGVLTYKRFNKIQLGLYETLILEVNWTVLVIPVYIWKSPYYRQLKSPS